MNNQFYIRKAYQSEYNELGQLIARVYSSLEGFPSLEENPEYYATFSDLGRLAEQKETKVLVAVDHTANILGGLVFYGHAKNYGSGVIDTDFPSTSGIRLLAVKPRARKRGIGKALTQECIERTKRLKHNRILLHTTDAMKTAWKMYENIGFLRWPELDFQLNNLTVYGFQLELN